MRCANRIMNTTPHTACHTGILKSGASMATHSAADAARPHIHHELGTWSAGPAGSTTVCVAGEEIRRQKEINLDVCVCVCVCARARVRGGGGAGMHAIVALTSEVSVPWSLLNAPSSGSNRNRKGPPKSGKRHSQPRKESIDRRRKVTKVIRTGNADSIPPRR